MKRYVLKNNEMVELADDAEGPEGQVYVRADDPELAELEDDSKFLHALFAEGVDSWEGYDAAQTAFCGEPFDS